MNKCELIKYIAKRDSITATNAKKVLDSVLSSIISAVSEENSIILAGFGSFYIQEIKARVGRNPKTGEITTIASYKKIKFKACKKLKDACN